MTSNLSREISAVGKQAHSGKETTRLRLLFLIPLGIAIIAIIAAARIKRDVEG